MPADLADFAVIDRMGAAVYERWRRLDVLVGNAGVLGVLSPLGHIDPKTWDQVIAVNLTANWRLIRGFDPLLRASDAGRAIFVTSGVAQALTWAVRRFEGRWRDAGAHLCPRVRQHQGARQLDQSRPDPHPHASRRLPREDPRTRKPADDPALLEAFVSLAEPACDKNGALITV